LKLLVPLIKTITFFKEREIQDQDFTDLATCLNYECYKAGENVFEFGSYGDKFYIILQGTVGVYIPNPDVREFNRKFADFKQKQ